MGIRRKLAELRAELVEEKASTDSALMRWTKAKEEIARLRAAAARRGAERILADGWQHVPPDHVVVPREPTEAMVGRALNTVAGHFGDRAVLVGELLGEGINDTGVDAASVEIVRDVLRAAISQEPGPNAEARQALAHVVEQARREALDAVLLLPAIAEGGVECIPIAPIRALLTTPESGDD